MHSRRRATVSADCEWCIKLLERGLRSAPVGCCSIARRRRARRGLGAKELDPNHPRNSVRGVCVARVGDGAGATDRGAPPTTRPAGARQEACRSQITP
eukprot:SAG31_NODE_4_length_45662_cov_15.654622_17_plen_98_part_00